MEPNWPFMDFEATFNMSDTFLIIEEKVKEHHCCVKNLKFFEDAQMKQKYQDNLFRFDYKFSDTIEEKKGDLKVVAPNKNGISKIILFYQYENGYEWPLLTS